MIRLVPWELPIWFGIVKRSSPSTRCPRRARWKAAALPIPPTPATITSYPSAMSPTLRRGRQQHLLVDVEQRPVSGMEDWPDRARLGEDPGPELSRQGRQAGALPVLLPHRAAVDELGDADGGAHRVGRWRRQPEPGRRLALGDPIGARGVEEDWTSVAGGPGPDLDRLAAREDEVDPGMADGESFHGADAKAVPVNHQPARLRETLISAKCTESRSSPEMASARKSFRKA